MFRFRRLFLSFIRIFREINNKKFIVFYGTEKTFNLSENYYNRKTEYKNHLKCKKKRDY